MDNALLTAAIVINSTISLVVLYLVAPLANLKAKVEMLRGILTSHDGRIQSIEERI